MDTDIKAVPDVMDLELSGWGKLWLGCLAVIGGDGALACLD